MASDACPTAQRLRWGLLLGLCICVSCCVQAGIAANFQITNPTLGAQLASYVAAYGTHYRESGRQMVLSLTAGRTPVPACHPGAGLKKWE
jgi:hypothetical protein